MTSEIVSTKDHPGVYDALETAKDDEPIFVVQGGDPGGPPTVQFWAEHARARARACLSGGKVYIPPLAFGIVDAPEDYQPSAEDESEAEKLLRKATNAEQVGWAMQAYQRGDVEPTGGRAHYNEDAGVDLNVDQLAEATQRKALIAMAGQLHNSLAIANSVSEGLAKLGVHPDVASVIDEAVENLKLAAEAVEPRRGSERS